MVTKRNVLLWMTLSFPSVVGAQSGGEDIQLIQAMYGKEKRDMIIEYMEIPEQYALAFWSTYERYEMERRELGNARLRLIDEYVENYASLTEEKADQLAREMLRNNLSFEKLHMEYYGKFKKASSALKAAQLMQFETFLQNSIRSELQAAIPFIGEVDALREAEKK